MSSYQTFTVLSNFCRLINLLLSYQYFVILSIFCRLIKLLLSTNHINMYHHTHNFGSAVIISPPLLFLQKQAASSQYRALWFVLQLRPPLVVSGTVESYKTFFLSAIYVVSFLFTLEKIFNTSTQSFTMNNAKQCYFEKRRWMSEPRAITSDEAMTSSNLFHSLTALNVKWLDLLTKSILKRLSQRV